MARARPRTPRGWRRSGIVGIGCLRRRRTGLAGVTILQTPHVAAELLLDLGGGGIEGKMRVGGIAVRLENQPLHDMCDDVGSKAIVVRPLAEGDLRRNGPREIFGGDALEPLVDMGPERLARFDLMAGNPNIHEHSPYKGQRRYDDRRR